MIEPVTFEAPERKLHRPSLAEIRALNGGQLPPIAGGSDQTWEVLINAYQSAAASGVAYKNSKTILDISPGAAVTGEACTIPAGLLLPGAIMRFTARGWFSTKAATEPTFIMGLYWGGVAGTALAVTGTNKSAAGVTEIPWVLEATTRFVAIGELGKAITHGTVAGLGSIVATTTAGVTTQHLPASKPQTEVTVNTALQKIVTLGGTWGTESVENTLTVTQWLVELLN